MKKVQKMANQRFTSGKKSQTAGMMPPKMSRRATFGIQPRIVLIMAVLAMVKSGGVSGDDGFVADQHRLGLCG
jgi:hypothetical protein